MDHSDETVALRRSEPLELVLIVEFIWLLFARFLPPLTVARLMICAFPSVPDAFLLANLAQEHAVARGLVSVNHLEKYKQGWAAVLPFDRFRLPGCQLRL